MSRRHRMSREVKGLVAGVAASVCVLGATFGTAALVQRHSAAPGLSAKQMSSGLEAKDVVGRRLFLANCAPCHGENAHGVVGPNLHALKLSDGQLENTIKNGRPSGMPAFKGRLKERDVRELVGYLRSLRK